MFSLLIKPDVKPNQASLRHVAYALHRPFKEELECLQKEDIITSLGVDEAAEWCSSLELVPRYNRKVRLCLDSARLIQSCIRLVHRGPTLNDILPELNNAQYLSYRCEFMLSQLKVDKKSSYLITFAYQFGRNR